jgi:hypothetical protein
MEKWSETTKKQLVFLLFFFSILRPIGHPQMDIKRYTKAQKWKGCTAQCLSLKTNNKHKPITKSLGLFLKEKWSETTRKHVFMIFLSFWGHLGTPKWTQKHTQRLESREDVWANV